MKKIPEFESVQGLAKAAGVHRAVVTRLVAQLVLKPVARVTTGGNRPQFLFEAGSANVVRANVRRPDPVIE